MLANDIVLMAEKENMRNMIAKFVRRKGLKLNTEKTKIMRCKKGRRNRIRWKWEGRYRGSEGIFGIYIAGSCKGKGEKKNSSDGEGMEHKKKKIWKGMGKKNVDV